MVVETNGRAMARVEQPAPGALARWDAEQTNVIKTLICPGASDAELGLFAQVCQQTGLSPFARQIYGLMRWDGRAKREVLSIQTSIDGFRLAAQRSGEYAGQVGPEWCGEDGVWRDVWLSTTPPSAARVGVLRTGWAQPTYGIASWTEYCQRGKDGGPTPMWQRMPATMLAKCAESLALRKVFPAELSGLYSREEMAQADNQPPTVTEAVQATAGRPVVVEGTATEMLKWQRTFDEQWEKGAARAAEVGAPLPPRNAPDAATATLTLKALATNIRLQEEANALKDAIDRDDARDERVQAAAVITGAVVPSEDDDPFRDTLIGELRAAAGEARSAGVPVTLPPLHEQSSEVLHTLLASLRNTLDAHAATAQATLA